MESVYAKNPTIGRDRLAREAKVIESQARWFIHEKKKADKTTQPVPETKPGSSVSVKDFVGKFDYAGLLRRTINRMCRTSFVSDAVVRSESGIPPASFRLVAEQPEFKQCQIKDRDGIWWSTEKNTGLVRKEAQKWGVQR
jgi:hypothetical protein